MKTLAFDIETADAERLHGYGPGFVRLCGWQWLDGNNHGVPLSKVFVSTDAEELVAAIEDADAVTAHNGLNFDLMALARWHGLDYEAAALKTFDTLVVEKHLDPVAAKGAQPNGYYSLDQTAQRYRAEGKSRVDFEGKRELYRRLRGDRYADRMKPGKTESFVMLDLLKDAYGGYDQIPQDDPDYVEYLVADVVAQGAVFRAQRRALAREDVDSQRYLRREHYVAAAMARITLEGMRIDTDLTMARWAEGQARLEASKQMMHERFGMPLDGKKPHTTNPGKAAFRRAILASGIREEALDANWPMNKDGSLSTAKDTLTGMIDVFTGRNDEAAELCRTILAMNGERTVYGTVLNHLVGDRVHPYIGPDQASGRWSMKDPGLTVLGKRGGKARERAMGLADEGEWLVAIDADQVDARVVAAECQDPEYMKLFAPGMDLHSEVAFRVWPDMAKHGADCHRLDEFHDHGCGVKDKCHCVLRDQAKVFGHGFSYGLGANGMARQHGVDVTVAQGFISGMTNAFRRLAEWKDETRQAAGAVGFDEPVPANDSFRILHTWAGRPVRVERNRAYTQATALIGQGGTRDVMAEAILKLAPEIRRKVRAVIHDEIVVSIAAESEAEAQRKAQAISDSMAFDLKGVAITFGCSRVSRTWAGTYGAEYEAA